MENKKDCLLIGEGVSITGKITLPGTIYVYGDLNGEITASEIQVGQNGKVTGDVKVDIADIKGEVVNSIQVKDTLIVRSTGKISGLINYKTLEIEHGGVIDGKVVKVAVKNDLLTSDSPVELIEANE
jgi:cytoskeletal protein CcmA (bactofilin family)